MDLNATAVELAEISLWLDTMVSGLQAPWFGLRLRRGNSLIGARRAVYTRAQVNDKSWLKATPTDVPLTGMVEDMADGVTARQTGGRIHHFLLPASGWGSAVEAKEARDLAPEAAAALKEWRTVDHRQAEPQAGRRAGRAGPPGRVAVAADAAATPDRRGRRPGATSRCGAGTSQEHTQAVTREQIEATLDDPNGAYQRLRRVMDAWAALWFWPLTDTERRYPAHPGPVDRGVPGAARPRARGAQEQPGHDATGLRAATGKT